MFSKPSVYVGLATVVVTQLAAPAAQAGTCGTFRADDGDNVIVYGEKYIESPVFGTLPTGQLGVCWRNAAGDWAYEEISGCRNTTPSTDTFVIRAKDGDDVVVPVVRESYGMDFVCPDPDVGDHTLGPIYVYPGDVFNPNADSSVCRARDWGCRGPLDFGVTVFGGEGRDEIHGSPSDDELWANEPEESCFTWGSNRFCFPTGYPSDASSDVMCAYGGTDELWGDDTGAIRDATCLDGGLGPGATSDSCVGRNGNVDIANRNTCTVTRDDARSAGAVNGFPVDTCCGVQSQAGCAPSWSDQIEQCVCEVDSYCCNNRWDSLCVSEVQSLGCGSCSLGLYPNGCFDVCQHTVDDPVTDETWVVPPLYSIMERAEGRDWIGRFTRPVERP